MVCPKIRSLQILKSEFKTGLTDSKILSTFVLSFCYPVGITFKIYSECDHFRLAPLLPTLIWATIISCLNYSHNCSLSYYPRLLQSRVSMVARGMLPIVIQNTVTQRLPFFSDLKLKFLTLSCKALVGPVWFRTPVDSEPQWHCLLLPTASLTLPQTPGLLAVPQAW